MAKKSMIGAKAPKTLDEQLRRIAEKHNRTRSEIVCELVRDFVNTMNRMEASVERQSKTLQETTEQLRARRNG